MFIQVIEGKTSDPAGLKARLDAWQAQCRPGAAGWLGSTSGVAADGSFIAMVRFESEAAAKANSDRPEQDAWWQETAKVLDADVRFRDSGDVDLIFGGGSDAAGFVQVMQGTCRDRDRANELEGSLMDALRTWRPELIGIVRAWHGDTFTEAAYFTDEASARRGEASEMPAETAPLLEEYSGLFDGMAYIDLSDPWLDSA